MSKLKHKLLTKSLGQFFLGEIVFSYAFFFAIWAPQNEPKKVCNGLQVSMMYSSMSKLKNKPPTKSFGPLFYEK
jgi:hypothetical protein